MEARTCARAVLFSAGLLAAGLLVGGAFPATLRAQYPGGYAPPGRGGMGLAGAGARSQNFIVTAPTRELAAEICQAAEVYRRDLALEWLGRELPPWRQPIPVLAEVHPELGAGGATSFRFDRGMPFDWSMKVQGTRERVLDSVLPHEISHAVFATHFGAPLPRWADEGACTTVEHDSERKKHEAYLIRFLHTDRGIPFNTMFALKQYPRDMLPLYAQGYSVARYLIGQGGKRKFIEFVGEGMQTGDWNAMMQKHYQYENLSDLQVTWLEWVRRGSPFNPPATSLAGGEPTIPVAFTPARRQLPRGGETLVATPAIDQGLGQFAQVSQSRQSSRGGESGALAAAYATPPRPSPESAWRQGEASTLSRPAPGGFYAAARDARQERGPLPPPPLTPSTVYSPATTGEAPLSAGISPAAPAEAPLAPVAPSSAVPPVAPPAGGKLLMQWNRPSNQPWQGEPSAVRGDLAGTAGGTLLR